MTNEQINKRTYEVQKYIQYIKNLKFETRDFEFQKCWDGMIDDLELIIINLPVEDKQELTDAQILQNKADGAREEWRHNRGDEEEQTDEEIQEDAQQRADDLEASRGQY